MWGYENVVIVNVSYVLIVVKKLMRQSNICYW